MADEAFKEELENLEENPKQVKRPVRRKPPISYYWYPLKSISYRQRHHWQEHSTSQKKKKKKVNLMLRKNLNLKKLKNLIEIVLETSVDL